MVHDQRAYLWDVEQACKAIFEFTQGMDEGQYRSDKMVRAAVERQFEIIGEALNQLRRYAPELAREITDVAALVAFRNVLIHGYARVDDHIVWRNIQGRLPDLHDEVSNMLARLEKGGA